MSKIGRLLPWREGFGWVSALLLLTAPWLLPWRPAVVPLVAALALLARAVGSRRPRLDPWQDAVVGASAAAAIATIGEPLAAAGWLLLAVLVGASRVWAVRSLGRRPDAADLVAVVGWGGAFLMEPGLLAVDRGGWLAPLLLVASARSGAAAVVARNREDEVAPPGPASRLARGTLSLRGVVLAGEDGLPRSVPLDLDLRAGESLAVVCDAPADAEALAATVAGRRTPREGEVLVDGVPLAPSDRLVAVVAPDERMVAGSLHDNLAALSAEPPSKEAAAALREACALDEVAAELGDRCIDASGSPLAVPSKMSLLAARVVPSEYRVVVVVDPGGWLNRVRRERWRQAVVRASLGRTSIWITVDRELARRASQRLELRHGALRRAEHDEPASG